MKGILKKLIPLILSIALVMHCLPAYAMDAEITNVINVNVSYCGDAKIGENIRNGSVTVDDFIVTAEITLTIKQRVTKYTLDLDKSRSNIRLLGAGDNESKFLYTRNAIDGVLCLVSDEIKASRPMEIRDENTTIIVNGQEVQLGNLLSVKTPEFDYSQLSTVGALELRLSVNTSHIITDRTVYEIKIDDDPKISEYSTIRGMPAVAEAGVEISFNECLEPSGLNARVDYHTLDGKKISQGEKFTMPPRDVVVGIAVKGGGGGTSSGPKVMKETSISLDLKNKNPDVYNGIKAPTVNDIKNALSVSSSVSGSGVKITDVTVDEIYDESFYDDVNYEKAQRWAGNLMISFTVRANENYTFTNSDIVDYDELIKWQKNNISIKFNGTKLEPALDKLQHIDGYFLSEYYFVGHNAVEIHIFWYGEREADYSLSSKKAGDTVTVPQSAFNYEGYFVYKYVLEYTDANNNFVRKSIEGKTFEMPAHRGEAKLSVKYLRGNGKRALQQITEDTEDRIKLDVTNAEFPQNTVVNVDLIKKNESGDEKSYNTANTALKDYATEHILFDISAKAYNQSVQPSGRVVVTFPMPQNYSGEHLSLCYVSEDGKFEEIPIEVANGVGVAVLEHFSLYAITKTKEAKDNTAHIIHVPEMTEKAPTCNEDGLKTHYKCSCGKLFSDANAKNEVTEESLIIPAGHTDANGDGECDVCHKKDVEFIPTVPSDDTSSNANDNESVSSETVSEEAISSETVTSASADNTPDAQGGFAWWWIVVGVGAATVIAVVIVFTIKKK